MLLMSCALLAFAGGARVKDIAIVGGVRDNQLTGYGLVVGLAGDGDKNPIQTLQTIANVLQRFGLTVPASSLSAKNVAIVMVTADIIPAFKKAGTRIDVNVASMGRRRRVCKAACCGKRRWKARTAGFMPWPRARFPLAAFQRARMAAVERRCKRIIPPSARSPMAH